LRKISSINLAMPTKNYQIKGLHPF